MRKLPRLVGSPWVFPSQGKTGHLAEPKKAWVRICTRAGLEGVRIHDLRRTVGSWLAAQGENLSMIGKILNHSQPSTTAIYARLHLEPVREALEKNAETMLNAISLADNSPELPICGSHARVFSHVAIPPFIFHASTLPFSSSRPRALKTNQSFFLDFFSLATSSGVGFQRHASKIYL